MSTPRICIKCGAGMKGQTVEGVQIDVCEGCGGLWLDKGEIWQLANRSEASLSALGAQLAEAAPKRGQGHSAYSEYEVLTPPGALHETPCPACQGKLALARLGPVQVEICAECDGLYLDRGELQKAIEELKDRGSALTTIASLARSVSASGTIGE